MADRDGTHLAKAMADEALLGAKALRLGDSVPNVDALTRAWLTDVICRNTPSAEVMDFSVAAVSEGTHDRHRITLQYNPAGVAADLPKTLFTKTLPTYKKRAMSGIVALRESYFYNTIRPLVEIEAPRCFASTVSIETYATIHAMEDLVVTKGARFADYRFPVNRAMAADMVGLLASLHGRFLADTERAPHERSIPSFALQFNAFGKMANLAKYTEVGLLDAGGRVPARLLRSLDRIWPATLKSLDLHRGATRTIIHSDVHIGNWYQTGTGAMGLTDWQMMGIGHWARDLSYALATALVPEDRRNWEKDLVALYADRLSQRSGTSISFAEAWQAYRHQMLPALAMWTITLRHDEALPDMQPEDMSLAMIERIATAMDDLETLALFDA
jgi:aminoglycoside phosphotransferase (APT) family kinase protein